MNENELTLEEDLRQRLGALPMPVRDYLTKGGIEETARTMTTRYRLHVDDGAVLARELLLVLMGIEQPAELAQTLQSELGLTPDQIKAILTDINTEVFQPLQDKMRAAPKAPVAAAPTPQPAPAAPRSAPAPAAPQPVRTVNEAVHTARQVAPPPNLPGAGAEPNIGIASDPNVTVYAAPKPAAVTPPAPPAAPVPVMPRAVPMPAAPQESARPILEKYGVDPYKEPIE
jgi:hypothetical protein